MRAAYSTAQRHGYTGTYTDYIDMMYELYCETCKRCGIPPLSRRGWNELTKV
jgi:hypothetical protein